MLTRFCNRCRAILRLVTRWKFFNVAVIVALLGTVGTMYAANRNHDIGVLTVRANVTVARINADAAATVARINADATIAVARINAEAQVKLKTDSVSVLASPTQNSP